MFSMCACYSAVTQVCVEHVCAAAWSVWSMLALQRGLFSPCRVSQTEEQPTDTPDTAVFSINCHQRHSALSIQHFNTDFFHFFFCNPADGSFKAAIFVFQVSKTCLSFPFFSSRSIKAPLLIEKAKHIRLVSQNKGLTSCLGSANT